MVNRAAFSLVILASALGAGPDMASRYAGKPINEEYRLRFGVCDRTDNFGAVHFPILDAKSNIRWYPCSSDPSEFIRFERVPAVPGSVHDAVVVEAKMARDDDGAAAACHGKGGPTDQCSTALMLHATAKHPCLLTHEGHGAVVPISRCVPVDPDAVPYVVIPGAGPKGVESGEFSRVSGIVVGDYGVVFANGKQVPVIVADVGPAYKIGEGSTALLRLLSANNTASPISSGVTYVLFPGTADKPSDLSPDTLADVVREKAKKLAGVSGEPSTR